MSRETHAFTIDLKTFIQQCMLDPWAAQQIKEGVAASKGGDIEISERLGACNLKNSDSDPDNYYSVFIATARDKKPHEDGYLARNGKGDRLSLRLRKQQRKEHTAVSDPVAGIAGLDNETAKLFAAAMQGDPMAAAALLAMSAQTDTQAPVEEPTQQEDASLESGDLDELFSLEEEQAPTSPPPSVTIRKQPEQVVASPEDIDETIDVESPFLEGDEEDVFEEL